MGGGVGGLGCCFCLSGTEVSGALGVPGFIQQEAGVGRKREKVLAGRSLVLFSWEPLVLKAGFGNASDCKPLPAAVGFRGSLLLWFFFPRPSLLLRAGSNQLSHQAKSHCILLSQVTVSWSSRDFP